MNQLLTPCVIQAFFICITVIISLYILRSYYKIYCSRPQAHIGNGENSRNNQSLPYLFWSSVILLIGIAIFSYGFHQNRTVLDFISLASALISIILAIITIIYSFYTNGRSVGQAEKLQEAAEEVQKATKAYSESAGSLQLNIQKILSKIDHVEANTNAIYNNIYNVSDEKGNHSGSKTEQLVRQSSALGTMALYAASLSKEHNKNFPLAILGELQNASYCSGFLIAVSCIDLIEVQLIIENNSIFISVDKYDTNLKDSVIKKINYYIEDADVDTDNKDFFTKTKEKIDQYFCNNPSK